MNDQDFFDLQLRATIVPQQVRWPAPEFVHWQRLHAAVDGARERVSKAYMQMDEIDRNPSLSRDDKYQQRSKSADEAIADFQASKTLTRAREAVKLAVAKNDSPDGDAMLKAMKETERDWQRAMDKIAERAGRTKSSRDAARVSLGWGAH